MATVIELDPWAHRLAPGTYALHGDLGVCRVLAAHGLWRTVETLDFDPVEGAAQDADAFLGERARPIEREVPVFALRALDPSRDLAPPRPAGVTSMQRAQR